MLLASPELSTKWQTPFVSWAASFLEDPGHCPSEECDCSPAPEIPGMHPTVMRHLSFQSLNFCPGYSQPLPLSYTTLGTPQTKSNPE